jgi:H+/Cl- antiporter ClcA
MEMGQSVDYSLFYYIIGIGLAAVFGIWSRSVAVRKGRYPIPWFLAGFLTFFIAVIVVYLLPTAHPYIMDNPHESQKSPTINIVECPQCGGSMLDGSFTCGSCGMPKVQEASPTGL